MRLTSHNLVRDIGSSVGTSLNLRTNVTGAKFHESIHYTSFPETYIGYYIRYYVRINIHIFFVKDGGKIVNENEGVFFCFALLHVGHLILLD